MSATDNIKALAKRHNTTPAAIRATADDLGVAYAYSADRRTWFIAEDATVVRRFAAHLAGN